MIFTLAKNSSMRYDRTVPGYPISIFVEMIKIHDEFNSVSREQHDGRMTAREQKLKENLISRLNRVEGQVRGIKGMLEKDAYCDQLLNQIAAAQAALNSVSKLVLENHIRGCVVEKIRNGEDEIIGELLNTIGRIL